MNIYGEKQICNGCRACEQICPAKCISMCEDEEGFLYPSVRGTECIHCGQCKKVCEGTGAPRPDGIPTAYAARTKDFDSRKQSSSGGVFFELGKKVIEDGGWVFGAVMDENWNVAHIGTDSVETLKRMRGSKYVQSNTQNTFREAACLLKKGIKVLYTGTPCQTAGLKSFLQAEYEELICCSIICHGVPSPSVWSRGLREIERKTGGRITNIRFRDKTNGWRSIVIAVETRGQSGIVQSVLSDYKDGFLENLFLRPSCHACRTKKNIFQNDLILGDYWGIEKYCPGLDDDMGCNAVLVSSRKGSALLKAVQDRLLLEESSCENIVRGNRTLTESVYKNKNREKFFLELSGESFVSQVIENNLKKTVKEWDEYIYQYPTVLRYLKNKISGYKTEDFFIRLGYRRIALYAMYELTILLCDDLYGKEAVEIVCICDKKNTLFENGYRKIPVVGIDELVNLYQQGRVDCVVVGYALHENTIIRDLAAKNIAHRDIFSINHLVFGLEGNI